MTPAAAVNATTLNFVYSCQGMMPATIFTGINSLAFSDSATPTPDVITRDRSAPRTEYGGFLALSSPRAGELQKELAERGVLTDSRGNYLRFGPAPYLSDEQLEKGIATLGELL